MSEMNHLSFGKVAVLAGGTSRERDISLQSGAAVLDSLHRSGVNAELIDTQELNLNDLKKFDCAFIALHGIGGEDGKIQALLEFLNLPYTGSGITASAIAMDKVLSKKIWQAAGLPLAESEVVTSKEQAFQTCETFGYPVMFKPSLEGSSVGISYVQNSAQVEHAFDVANMTGQQVIIEKFIQGEEYSVGILDETALPSVRLSTKRDFYDFQAKYVDDDTEYFCPSGLNAVEEKQVQDLALAAFKDLSCSGWGRVDFMRSPEGQVFILEVNTSPGLTSHSLVPIGAKQASYSFDNLVIKILQSAITDVERTLQVVTDETSAIAREAKV